MKRAMIFLVIFLLGVLTFVSADVLSINSGGDGGLIINPDKFIEGFFSEVNKHPNDPSPVLVSVDGSNESDANLNCSTIVTDPDNLYMNVSVRWYKDAGLNLTVDYLNQSNGTLIISILDSGNLTLGETWYCSVQVDDGKDTSAWVDSNTLTITDITDPIVTIISPLETNYSNLDIDFNVSIVENENVSLCVHSIDGASNITMTEVNDSYFWDEPNLGPGGHDVWFFCNDTTGNWGGAFVNFTIDSDAAISILLSSRLAEWVKWNVITLPIDDLDAEGNNGTNATDYWVNISATNTLVDLYIRSDGDLQTIALDTIPLENENFTFSSSDPNVTGVTPVTMNTSYIKIGDSLGDNSTVYLKFYLDAIIGQAAGVYTNQLDIKAVIEDTLP